MTIKQSILKLIYPLIIKFNKRTHMNTKILENTQYAKSKISVYDIPFELNNGKTQTLSAYKNKKILIINTASACGYTNQYEGLEKLYEQNGDKVQLIAFPSNNFKEQEKGSDAEIAQFCKVNYGVTFPLAKKSVVIKAADQNKIFEWLSNKEENGWLEQEPTWNFCKYLIDEKGVLTHFFEAAIEPLGEEITAAIKS
ncbi:MAG: glutathione peroxidase [Parafilimonas sp.]|nr:glutathione peroxidase [Parafilimonas sp.]